MPIFFLILSAMCASQFADFSLFFLTSKTKIPQIMETLLLSLVGFAVVISIIVFVHEGGHYLVARACGVRVEVFSIGFGKEIFGWNDRHGTRWRISMLPLGGYVKMLGDTDPSSHPDLERIAKFSEQEKKEAFYLKPLVQKAAIVAAGPLTNFIFSIFVIAGLFSIVGKAVVLPVVSAVMQESAAEEAGLKIGDKIIAVDSNEISSFSDIQRIISINTGDAVRFDLERENKVLSVMVTPRYLEREDVFGNRMRTPTVGIQAEMKEYSTLPVGQAVREAALETWHISAATLKVIGQIVTGKRGTEDLSGPIRIAKYSGQSLALGVTTLFWFMALVSINLGMMNLLPIPALDGGHLLYYAVEALRGKPMADKVQNWGLRIGMAMIITLAIFVTINDVIQLGRS